MGYTQYVTVKKPIPADLWEAFIKAKEYILKKHQENGGCAIEDLSQGNIININGVGDSSHENLYLEPDYLEFNFCKTAGKPYDVVVVALLCALNLIAKDYVQISSDGGKEDWVAGQKLAIQALGRLEIPDTI